MIKKSVSVCIATYNGEKYIAEQLDSILTQIGSDDEVIIVDDNSNDNTLKVINSIGDSRIKIHQLQENIGHVKAFEVALSIAEKNIIFLSDQDDIWVSDKYQRVLAEFDAKDNPVLVVHGLSTINSVGELILSNWLTFDTSISAGFNLLAKEVIKPSVFGSAAAFRSSLLELMLPFPKLLYAHDHWLVICASMTNSTKFMSGNYVKRRIHENNITPKHGGTLFNKIFNRVIFVGLIFITLIRLKKKGFNFGKQR
jgi:glycosyltransferase involved in cell wall biosynthesis